MMARHNARFRRRDLITPEYPLSDAARVLEEMERLAIVKGIIRPSRTS